MGWGPLLSQSGRGPHLAPLPVWRGFLLSLAGHVHLAALPVRGESPLTFASGCRFQSGILRTRGLKIHLSLRGGGETCRSHRSAGRRRRARPAVTGRRSVLSCADWRAARALGAFVRHTLAGDRCKGGDRARGRSRARRRLVKRKTESRCITSLAGGQTPMDRQTVVGTAGKACMTMVRPVEACTAEVRSAEACAAAIAAWRGM